MCNEQILHLETVKKQLVLDFHLTVKEFKANSFIMLNNHCQNKYESQ